MSAQSFLFQPIGQQVGNLYVVLLGKKEMRVALDALLRQMYHCGIASVTVNALGKQLCHLQPYTPTVHRPIITWFVRNVVAIIYDNRYARELHEIVHRNGCG